MLFKWKNIVIIPLSMVYLYIGYVLFTFSNSITESENKHNMAYLLGKYQSEILIKVNEYLTLSQVYKYLIYSDNESISEDNFNIIANNLITDFCAIKSLQLAPDGFVQYAYPKKGNEKVYIDLFSDEKRREDAIFSRDNRISMMSEPLELFQGGSGLIIRTPVFIGNQFNDFWGFSIVILDLNKFINTLSLNDLSRDGFNYKLSFLDKNKNTVEVINESSNETLVNSINHEFSVLNQKWILSVSSNNGWIDPIEYRYKVYLIFFFVFALSIISYMLINLLEQKKKMYRLSYIDPLTGLYNRRAFDENANDLFKDSILYFSDLNEFKNINDSYGHEVGDLLLVEVSKRMSLLIKDKGCAFRLGGDEFAIFIKKKEVDDIYFFKDKILHSICEPMIINGLSIIIGISIGYSIFPYDGENKDELIRIADERMYEMKFKEK
jgi:diguanylate cyclase (GGDEF)-like protein